ncbi:MAG: RluA family pseudouridine synthase, partial [Planctomycetota bacterium]|nr:RluA family pseudouridine synthase [Planctomycetota bacterium]
ADATGDRSLLEAGKEYLKAKYRKPGAVFLGLVHRLDRPVSGLVVFARTSKAAARLSEQFRGRTVQKIYRAVVEGRPPSCEGRLQHFLSGAAHRLKVAVAKPGRGKARRAEIRYRLLQQGRTRSELEIELITGLKHQIRVQLAAIGCPIVGDFKYSGRSQTVQPLANGRAIALHAWRLVLQHPTQPREMSFVAPLPDYWPECE